MMELRIATNHDCELIIELISSVLEEYGEKICLEGAERDLLDIEAAYFGQGGSFWVLENAVGDIVGSHAAMPLPGAEGHCTFKRLYLAESLRGTEYGASLMQETIEWARRSGFRKIEFWSDTRFKRAHAFFEKFEFCTDKTTRQMTDSHRPYSEYRYWLDLGQDDCGN